MQSHSYLTGSPMYPNHIASCHFQYFTSKSCILYINYMLPKYSLKYILESSKLSWSLKNMADHVQKDLCSQPMFQIFTNWFLYSQFIYLVIINPFQLNVAFQYLLKTSENQRFYDFFRVYRNETFGLKGLNENIDLTHVWLIFPFHT